MECLSMEWIFAAFLIKHFICDFPLQSKYQSQHKGRYGHPGGLLHAGIHAIGTLIVCRMFGLPLWLCVPDAAIHYHIDWAKMRLNARWRLTPRKPAYWWLLGLDQLLHQLTYVALIAVAT